MILLFIAFSLLLLVILSSYLNRSYLLSLYFTALFLCDFASWLRQHLTSYPKPYQGVGFVLFGFTTALYLLIPVLAWLTAIYSFTGKIAKAPILAWIGVSGFCLSMYPQLRGQPMMTVFYAYYLSSMIGLLVYMLSKAKSRFTFTQGALLLASLGSIVTTIFAIKEVTINQQTLQLQSWDLIVVCNCMFYTGLIFCSWLNRSLRQLLP